jgi:YD repeat-containing protein
LTSAASYYDGYGGISYSWDGNGDSTLSGYVTGKGNRLLNDGTYKYVYDKAGHVTQRYTSTAETDYTWDNRGRLVTVKDYTKSGSTLTQVQQVDLWYDAFNNLIGRTLTPYISGNPGTPATARFIYDGPAPGSGPGHAVLAFNGNQSLTDRYLWGPALDQILADERFTPSGSNWMPSSAGTTYWALTDNARKSAGEEKGTFYFLVKSRMSPFLVLPGSGDSIETLSL